MHRVRLIITSVSTAILICLQGVWTVESKNIKIPVAIKKLNTMDGTCGSAEKASNEFLDEAYIMASVEHEHLLKLLAVCIASEMMLISQLMPLGCLLSYVRNKKNRVGSEMFLTWCTQIAKGKAFESSYIKTVLE